MERLLRETGDFKLVELHGVAERLHVNFYENFIDAAAMKGYVKRLKAKLEGCCSPFLLRPFTF